jgi:hypothetical protein
VGSVLAAQLNRASNQSSLWDGMFNIINFIAIISEAWVLEPGPDYASWVQVRWLKKEAISARKDDLITFHLNFTGK